MQAVITNGLEAFLSLERPWRSLLDTCRAPNPFLTWEWVSEWARTFWQRGLVTVLVEAGATTVAIAPFLQYEGLDVPGLKNPSLALMGPRRLRHTLEMPEILVNPDFAVPALRLVVEELAIRLDWKWIEATAIGAGLTWWRDALDGLDGVRTVIEGETSVPTMRLDGSWEELRGRLRRNIKESIRRSYNSPRRAALDLVYSEHCDSAGLDAALDDFFTLHRARANVRGSVFHPDDFEDRGMRRLFAATAHRLAESGHLNIGSLALNGKRVAIHCNFDVGGELFLFRSGFDPALWRHSVSTRALVDGIKSAIDRGVHSVNFLTGVDPAKTRWDVRMTPLQRLHIVRTTTRADSVYTAYAAMRRARSGLAGSGATKSPSHA